MVDLDQFERALDQESTRLESWRIDHLFAELVGLVEGSIESIDRLFRELSEIDTEWHSAVMQGEEPYEGTTGERIVALHSRLADWGRKLDRTIEGLEAEGYAVEGAAKHRLNVRELQGILTDDSVFFDDERLLLKQEEAIEEHAAGLSEPFEELDHEPA